MSRLNYILPRHRTQSRTFAYMINGTLFAPDLIWQDVGDLLDPNYLQTLRERKRERERERERERLYSACIRISCNLDIFEKISCIGVLGVASRARQNRIFDSIDALRAFNRMAKCLN